MPAPYLIQPFAWSIFGIQGRVLATATAGSDTAMVPAIQPSSMPPMVMMSGKRSISLMTSWLPQTMIGMLITRPKMTNGISWWSAAPWAAPAMAMTLSMLITRSATMMVLMAASSLSLALMLPWSSSGSGASSLMPIQTSSTAPASFRNGMASKVNAK